MLKESEKSINIENIDNKGGTINFYVNDEKDENPKTIPIAAVDKNSTPLEGYVEISPWGEDLFKLSFRLTEKLNNQSMYQKYLVYDDEEKIKEVRNQVIAVFEELQNDATKRRRHSAYLVPKGFKMLENISKDAVVKYHDVEDASLSLRFDNNQFDSHSRDNPEPYGWVGEEPRSTYTQGVAPNIAEIVGVPTQYSNPGRTGILEASKTNTNIKVASKKKQSISKSLISLYKGSKPTKSISNNINLLYSNLKKNAQLSLDDVRNMTLPELHDYFNQHEWDSAYGGPAWAAIVNALIRLQNAKRSGDLIVWIDHIIDIQHNTGSVFTKDDNLNEIVNDIIKLKTEHNSFVDFFRNSRRNLSPEVRNLYDRMFRYERIMERNSQRRRNKPQFIGNAGDRSLFYDFYGLNLLKTVVDRYGDTNDRSEYEFLLDDILSRMKNIFVNYLTYAVYREARHTDRVQRDEDIKAKEVFDDIYYAIRNNKKVEDIENIVGKLEIIKKSPRQSKNYARFILQDRWPEAEDKIKRNPKEAYEYAYDIIKGPWPEAEEFIAKSDEHSYSYAINVLKDRFPEGEPAISDDPYYAWMYIRDILRAPWPEAEEALIEKAEYAAYYAHEILNKRFPEGEDIISKDSHYASYYANYVIKGRWEKGERAILNSMQTAVHYAQHIIKDRWPEFETKIMNQHSTYYMYRYAYQVIKGRWPEAEPYILNSSDDALNYARDVIKGPWPEAEDNIALSSNNSFLYAFDVLGDRFLKGEPQIIRHHGFASYLREFVKERDPKLEEIILHSDFETFSYSATTYMDALGVKDWPEYANAISSNVENIREYLTKVRNPSPMPQAESLIAKYSDLSFLYAKALRARFVKGEPSILDDPYYAPAYLENFIQNRWDELEKNYLRKTNYRNFYFRYLVSEEIMSVKDLLQTFSKYDYHIKMLFNTEDISYEEESEEEEEYQNLDLEDKWDYFYVEDDGEHKKISNNIKTLYKLARI